MKALGTFVFFAGCLLLPLLPGRVVASEVQIQSETILRVMERDTVEEEDLRVIPAYEYFRIDAGALTEKGVSFHLYGWGRADLGDGEFYDDDSAGELLYGYLEYAHPESNVDFRLGRQYLFEGLPGDSVDGLRIKGDLTPYLTFSLYGGLPVALDSERGRDGDLLYGGRVAHHVGTHYEIGVSYKKLENDDLDEEEKVAVDFSFTLPRGLTFDGFSSRNQLTNEWAEHAYEMGIRFGDFLLRPTYTEIDYGDFFNRGATGVMPFALLATEEETLRALGSDLIWQSPDDFELGARFKSCDYYVSHDSTTYLALLGTWRGEGLSQVGGEAGYMDGDAESSDYFLARAFFYWDAPSLIKKGHLSGDVVFVSYDEPIYGEDTSFFVSLGGGGRFFDDVLQVKVSGDYSSDPYFDEDVRGTLTLGIVF